MTRLLHLAGALGTVTATLLAMALLSTSGAREQRRRSGRTFDWMVQIDDSPRWSSTCVAVVIGSHWAIAPTHCLASGRAYLRTRSAVHVSSSIHSLEGRDLSLIDFPHSILLDDFAPVPLASVEADRAPRWGARKYWIILPSGRLGEAKIVDISSTLISATTDAFPLCYGDSGRPLLREDADGEFQVAGLLSYGDARCRSGGINRYARIDTWTVREHLPQPTEFHRQQAREHRADTARYER